MPSSASLKILHPDPLASHDLPEAEPTTRYPFYYRLNQDDFEQVLRENLRAQYGITPEYGRELTDLTQDSEKVTISITDHRYGRTELTAFDWVIGCDGVHSRVRGRAGIPFRGEQVGVMALMDVEIANFQYDDSWVPTASLRMPV